MDEKEPPVEDESPATEASVWRLGAGGLLISSVVEKHAAKLAEEEMKHGIIYFYADLSTDAAE